MGNKKKQGYTFCRKRKKSLNDGMFGSRKRRSVGGTSDICIPDMSAEQNSKENSDKIIEEFVPDFQIFAEHNEKSDEEYVVEEEQENVVSSIEGRRLINIMHFFNKLKDISNHNNLFNCGFQSLSLVGEKRTGFIFQLKIKCEMCGSLFLIDSDDPNSAENIDTNTAAVIGVVSSGISYAQLEEITSSINLPVFTEKYYNKIQDKVFDEWESTAIEEMETAAERERQAAFAEGRVKDGIPVIDVYADGCWSSRSYGNNYKALSGAAVIIGRKYGEVLFMAVKNKYCAICARAKKKQTPVKDHICYKNYEGSSSGMEADIICEGFRQSLVMHNMIYGRLIADGDSATYAKILAQNPYPNLIVAKIECRNHILRNLCNKLRAASKEVKYPLKFRKQLTDQKVMGIRKTVVTSIKEQKKLLLEGNITKSQAVLNLHEDIQNSVFHVFGDHGKCKKHYCDKDTMTSSMEVVNSTFWFRLKVIIGTVASKSQSLVEDVDTNKAECFNSVVAKIVGGKRIFFSSRRAYQGRCAAAVVAYNNRMPRYTIQKNILGRSPRSILKKMEAKRNSKKLRNRINKYRKNRLREKSKTISNEYGKNSAAPDMDEEIFEMVKQDYLQNLNDLTENRDQIEKDTRLQRDCNEWLDIRKNMITASTFGKIAKRRPNTSSANLVKNLLYSKNISHVTSIAHGAENERLALQQLEQQENIKIKPCGIFIHDKYRFMGATPDGVIDDETIVEIKCPVAAYKIGINEAIKHNKIEIYKYNKNNNNYVINKNSNWYYQIQGQLHISKRKKCLLGIWGGQDQELKVEFIKKDDNFWFEKMEEKLVTFYYKHLLNEIVDSRYARGMALRDGPVPTT